jgi:predicted phage terminase large subunit-like protein
MQASSKRYRKKVWDWFEQTFASRLNDKKNGAITLVMQRLHEDDIAGRLMKKHGWTVLNLPAIPHQDITYAIGNFSYHRKAGEPLDPKRTGTKELSTIKQELGSYGYNAQYLQQPLHRDSSIIKVHWLKKIAEPPQDFEAIYHSWDCAVKPGANTDYTVCTVWGVKQHCYYLIDLFRQKVSFPQLKEAALALATEYQPNAVLIEDKASGQALLQELREKTSLPILGITPKHDKITRALEICHIIESGRVCIPENISWRSELENELSAFPNASHDDIVDSISQFLKWINYNTINNLRVRELF